MSVVIRPKNSQYRELVMVQRLPALVISHGLLIAALTGCIEPPQKFAVELDPSITHIVSPVDADGYIDYLEAANQRHEEGVSPDNNWEVVVRHVFGPLDWGEASDIEYYRRLGIQRLNADLEPVDYFQPLKQNLANPPEDEKKRAEQFWNIRGPWQAEDYPEFAEWLQVQSALWDRLVAGSHLPRNYIPHVMSAQAHVAKVGVIRDFFGSLGKSADSRERVAAALMQSIAGSFRDNPAPLSRWHVEEMSQQSREAARVLITRAFLRIGEDDIPGAESDLLAVHRIASLVSQGMPGEWMMGSALEFMACHADATLLQSGKLTKESCESYLAELDRLPPFVSAAEQLDVDCRHRGLDALQFAAIHHQEAFELMKSSGVDNTTRRSFAQIDWNEAMRVFNSKYDTLVAAARISNSVRRLAQFKEVGPRSRSVNDLELLEEMQQAAKENGDLTQFMAELYFDRYTVNLSNLQLRTSAYRDVVRTACAAYLHRFAHGAFPKTIEALVPLLGEVPIDPFAGEPLRLAVTENDFVIYSIGVNQVDDGGCWFDHHADQDDLRIRLSLSDAESGS